MKILGLAALAATLALPAHARETPAPPSEDRAGPVAAEGKTPRERARIAKAQNRDVRCAPRKQKKAAAT